MILCENTLADWVYSNDGLLITRSKMNINEFDYNKAVDKLYVCVTGYKHIINMFFTQILERLRKCNKIILIIIETDVVTLEKKYLDDERILHVYTWNKPFEHEKMTCIPIGLNYNRQYEGINKWLNKNNVGDIISKKGKLLCMNCSLTTSEERIRLKKIMEEGWSGFCNMLEFRPSKGYYIASHIEGKILINVTDTRCYDDWKEYKYILSPQGAGLDCHRTWEAILCGVIPIVKTSSIDSIFEKLPVLIVKEWEEITESFLNEKYVEIDKKRKNDEYENDRVGLEYWTNMIKDTKSRKDVIHFISYGSARYDTAKRRLCEEAKLFGEFETIYGAGPEDLPEKFREKYKDILNRPRGGGYWLWKPMIVYEKFKTMKYGEYLVYLDAGCALNSKGKGRFYEYIKMLKESDSGILTFQMHDQLEKWWTTKEIFEYFDLDPDGIEANSGQFVGGVFILRKNKNSEEYIKKLVGITLTQSNLYTDVNNLNGRQMVWFKDNRHDQSISSLLRKKHGSIVIPIDESYIVPFGSEKSLIYPFWAKRSKL